MTQRHCFVTQVGDAIEALASALDPDREKPFRGDILDLLEWAAKDVLAMRAEIATMKAEKFEAGNNQTIFMVRISELLQQLAAKDVEIERLKTVPMKYRRMAFNAQLQDENESLRQQLAERDAQIVLLRDGLAMAVSIIGHPDDYGTKHMQKILATTGPKEQEE